MSKNSLCPEGLNGLGWGSDSGSFIIWGLVGWCDRRSALDQLHSILFFWANGTQLSASFMQLCVFRGLCFPVCVAGGVCSSEAGLLNLYLHVMEVMGLEK